MGNDRVLLDNNKFSTLNQAVKLNDDKELAEKVKWLMKNMEEVKDNNSLLIQDQQLEVKKSASLYEDNKRLQEKQVELEAIIASLTNDTKVLGEEILEGQESLPMVDEEDGLTPVEANPLG